MNNYFVCYPLVAVLTTEQCNINRKSATSSSSQMAEKCSECSLYKNIKTHYSLEEVLRNEHSVEFENAVNKHKTVGNRSRYVPDSIKHTGIFSI